MTKQRAKYTITNIFVNSTRGESFTNANLLDEVMYQTDLAVTLKTVQNITAGLKSHGGLRSSKDDWSGSLSYTRISKAKVLSASEFIF